ncbi:hypothetical protein [Wenxinia marina]|uniref:Uncharacterized protein n=1 Tax=Wenxinia marina DSM 24838 TaxID=1123501 RepID=A0A0D0Q108_9RHOB|nr:hypothetical protein [Wenxinia marina]KIQ68204.1 hypothetical protein Wenmar_03214 [Wenxinia marina DSM 24838]GGL76721.1 hypothetical protein GCM10011392_33980 [Wenxinia marina]
MLEADFIPILCALFLNGTAEVSHGYSVGYDLHRVRVDCETETQVIEIGLDRRSSLDSLQQALFFAALTGKAPAVVLIDTDGREGPYELQIRTAAEAAGVSYSVFSADYLLRWQMTSWLRERRVTLPGS